MVVLLSMDHSGSEGDRPGRRSSGDCFALVRPFVRYRPTLLKTEKIRCSLAPVQGDGLRCLDRRVPRGAQQERRGGGAAPHRSFVFLDVSVLAGGPPAEVL